MPEGSPAPSTQPNLTWIHQDPRGIGQAIKDAFRRAQAGRWSRGEASSADYRALLLGVLAAAAALGPVPPRPVVLASGTALGVNVLSPSARDDNKEIQKWLALGVLPLIGMTQAEVKAIASSDLRPATVETQGGSLPSGPTRDAGAVPAVLAGVAIVSFFTGLGGAITVYFSQRNELDAIKAAGDERVAKHAASLATMSGLIETHLEAEQRAGKTLPWDPIAVSTIETLKKSTVELAQVPEPKMETTPKLGDVTAGIGKAIGDVGDAAKGAVTGAGIGLGAVAAGAAILWLMNEDNRRRVAA